MDTNRRKFLKIILIGGGTFVLGRLLDPFLSKLVEEGEKRVSIPSPKPTSSLFKIVEDEKFLSIYDDSGQEVFQIDKTDDRG